jgi:hypothetical protein
MNTARQGLAGSVNGTQTAALGFGGNVPPYTGGLTEAYDGTSWTAETAMSYSKNSIRRGRNSSFCFSIWWGHNRFQTATEEFTGAGAPLTQTITVS